MYAIDIASKAFEGTTIVKQHRMVNQILKEEIKDMHGLQVNAIQDEHEQVTDASISSRHLPNRHKHLYM